MKNFIHHDIGKLTRKTYTDGSRVYETPTGRLYPSVTSVTGLLTKNAIKEWRQKVGEEEANKVSVRATKRGTRIHSLCESYLRNETTEPDMFDSQMFQSITKWLDDIDNIHCLETPLYSDYLQVAGTVDCIAEFQGKLSVIDFKTSSRIKQRDDIHQYFMQTAAYAVSFEERTKIPVTNLVIIMGIDNDSPKLFLEKRDDWIFKFLNLRYDYGNLYKI